MILYVCDTCRSSIEASELRHGGALLIGDRAYCRRCNPREQKVDPEPPSRRASGGNDLVCDSCARDISARDLRSGLAGPAGGLLLCAACTAADTPVRSGRSAAREAPHPSAGLGQAHHSPGHHTPSRSGFDGVYLAGMIGLFVLLPIVAAFVAYRMGSERGNDESVTLPEEREDSRSSIADRALGDEILEVRNENAKLLERVEELSGNLAAMQRERASQGAGTASSPGRDPGQDLLAHRLETLDRTIQRLETSLERRIEGGEEPSLVPPVSVAPPETARTERVGGRSVGDRAGPAPGGDFGLLLDALASGRTLPAEQLRTYLDDEDASVRMMACKVAGAAATSAPGSSIDLELLKKVMKRLHDRDVGVQRAAIAAASAINGERYVAWDELDARDYAMMARIRQMWGGVEARADPDGASAEGDEDR